MVGNNSEFMQTHDIICPNRVEFRSDGQAPIYQSNAFEVITIKDDGTEDELIYPEWQINQEQVLTLVESTSTYPDLIDPTGSYFTKPEDNTCYALAFSAHTLNGNAANPNAYAQQWTEDLLTDEMFTYISFTYGTATVAQAIAFAQNLYPSSLVNEWDGQSLSLDEENSAIIAKMIAAGTKDQKNRFTGVMMGDWSEKGDSSLDVPGLYGFNAGAQSFGFKTDGTGFIGPAGEGRIQFDGRNALISNSAKTCYINLNPRRIEQFMTGDDTNGYTLDNQAWDSVGNQSYSQYFLYSKAPRRVNSFSYIEDDGKKTDNSAAWVSNWDQHTDLLWVKPFLEDTDNDYFIVDPNYGVATTGGIFARYGRLGYKCPWIISDYGLTQKNIYGRIFLGNPEKNLSLGTNIPTPTFTTSNGETEDTPANFYSASFSNVNNVIQTGIRADGYLYTRFATIGGWYINDHEIYVVDASLDINKGMSKGFRKTQTTTDNEKSEYIDEGYKLDLLNINSKDQFIAFNNGRFIINGQHGWMGFYNDDNGNTIDLNASPSVYNMLINFKQGLIDFGKLDEDANAIPLTRIDGITGNAYFAGGQVIISGEDASIYCGVSQTWTGSLGFDYGTPVEEGKLYLANIEFHGITKTYKDSEAPPKIVLRRGDVTPNAKNDETVSSNTNDTASIEKFSTIWGGDGETGFDVSSDVSYNKNTVYFTDKSLEARFVPTFKVTPSIVPSGLLNCNYTTLLARLGYSVRQESGNYYLTNPTLPTLGSETATTNTGTGTTQHTFVVRKNLGETEWTYNHDIINLSDYGITIQDQNSNNTETGEEVVAGTDLNQILISVAISVSNWQSGLYVYYNNPADLSALQGLPRSATTTATNLPPLEIEGTGVFTIGQYYKQAVYGMKGVIAVDADDENVERKIVLQPIENTIGYLYDWHLDVPTIFVSKSLRVGSEGVLQADSILMKEDLLNTTDEDNPDVVIQGYGLVATQEWVNRYVTEPVWESIKTVNNAAAAAMKKAKDAWDRAGSALSEIKETNAALAQVVETTLTDAVLQWVSVGEYAGIGIKLTRVSGDVVNYNWSDLQPISTTRHYHKISGIASSEGAYGRSIKVSISKGYSSGESVEAGNLSLAGALKGIPYDLTGDSATGELSWSTIGGTAGNFNIADTQYFKDAVAAAQEEGYAAAIARCSIDTSTNKVSIAAGTFAEQSTTSKKVSASLSGSHTFDWDYSSRIYLPSGTFTDSGGTSHTLSGSYYWYRGISSECSDTHSASLSWTDA